MIATAAVWCDCREYHGHSSHVMDIHFSPHNKWVISAGGKDRAIFQWKVYPRDPPTAAKPIFQPAVYTYEPGKRRALITTDALSEASIRVDLPMPPGTGPGAGAKVLRGWDAPGSRGAANPPSTQFFGMAYWTGLAKLLCTCLSLDFIKSLAA